VSENSDAPGVGPGLGGSGPCPTVVGGGKTWTIGHPTQRAKAHLEILTAATAIDQLEELKPVLKPEVWARRAAELDAKIDGGQHRTWCPLWSAVNGGPNGTPLFLLSLMRDHHPEATLADVRELIASEPMRVRAALACVVPRFFILLAESAPIPPEMRAKLVQQGIEELTRSFDRMIDFDPSSETPPEAHPSNPNPTTARPDAVTA
jgi:hypothetical protein